MSLDHWKLNNIDFILWGTYRIGQRMGTHLKVRVGLEQGKRMSNKPPPHPSKIACAGFFALFFAPRMTD